MKIELVKTVAGIFMIKLNKGVHIINLKQALNLKKVHRIIKFMQKTWLTSYIDMNTDLEKKMQKLILQKTSIS